MHFPVKCSILFRRWTWILFMQSSCVSQMVNQTTIQHRKLSLHSVNYQTEDTVGRSCKIYVSQISLSSSHQKGRQKKKKKKREIVLQWLRWGPASCKATWERLKENKRDRQRWVPNCFKEKPRTRIWPSLLWVNGHMELWKAL